MSKQTLKTAIRDHQKRTGSNYTTARREVLSEEHDTSPQPFLSQAASTTDPEVIRALEDIDLLKRHFRELRIEFVDRVTGGGEFYSRRGFSSSSISVNRLSAVGGDEKPSGEFGRWKQGPRGRGWVPAKNSKMEEEFDALNDVPHVPIPGTGQITTLLMGNYMVSPVILALDGTVWLYFRTDPEPHIENLNERDRIGVNWVRERPSGAIRAIEDWNERYAGTSTPPLSDEEKSRVEFLFAEERRRKEARAEEMREFWAEREAGKSTL